jgi:hypothetical protein
MEATEQGGASMIPLRGIRAVPYGVTRKRNYRAPYFLIRARTPVRAVRVGFAYAAVWNGIVIRRCGAAALVGVTCGRPCLGAGDPRSPLRRGTGAVMCRGSCTRRGNEGLCLHWHGSDETRRRVYDTPSGHASRALRHGGERNYRATYLLIRRARTPVRAVRVWDCI